MHHKVVLLFLQRGRGRPLLYRFFSSGRFKGPSSGGGAGESGGHGSTANPPTLPQLPSAPWTVSSSHAQKQAAPATGSH